MSEKRYIIRARNPLLDVNSKEYDNYITTNADFKKYCNEIFDLEDEDNDINPIFKRYVKNVCTVNTIDETFIEDRDAVGFKKKLATSKGLVHIGYSRIREEYIYVEYDGLYYRGYRIFWANLCLVGSNKYVPLDKSYGNGNIEIIEWNRRHGTKSIKCINNKLQTIMYRVDKVFNTLEEVQEDMESPKDSDMGKVIQTML